ncbi:MULTISPECIES: HdeA/HdeB family chaperone [unclassified Erwinia]|uniref:HdeA/HdeB family chaperone n=1 Tax=unclassified Erwinia TaxID=2622719 RepID=UPI0008302FE6|nr:HdeA/HdeB family chaperone [Erwinia sp. ErVv1]
MNVKTTLSAFILCAAISAPFCSAWAESSAPTEMSCKEFINLNPKAMSPVAFWALNKDIDFKGGDFVDMNQVNTLYIPKLTRQCKTNPNMKVVDAVKNAD